MSPYIVTTARPEIYRPVGPPRIYRVTHQTVATLAEARDAAEDAVNAHFDPWIETSDPDQSDEHRFYRSAAMRFTADAAALPESGGTIGPLPDGTVIEVEKAEEVA